MAKAKKKEVLTQEEKLEQALVPVEEQPYEVPENWCWTTLGMVSEVVTGNTPSKNKLEYYGGDFPFFKPADLDAGRHTVIASEYLSDEGRSIARIIPAGATAVCCIGSIGKSGYLEIDGTTNQQINSVIPKINPLYLYYFINTNTFINELWEKSSATTISIVNKSKMETNKIPLPPLAEQQRIVEQIESLFAKLDEAKEKVENVLQCFEKQQDSIMYEAFSGRLTQTWREFHGILKEDWIETTIRNVCNDIKVGIVIKPTQYYTDAKSGIPAFRSANVRNCHIEDSEWVYIDKQGHQDNKRSEVREGDVLIVRSGNPGTACVVTKRYDGYNAIDIIIAVPNDKLIDSNYLCYYTNSPVIKNLIKQNKRGVALQHFNVGGYSKLPILLPTIEEQKEIVRLLQEMLEKEVSSQKTLHFVLQQVDLMKKSILAKAFRGELGTNNPNEGSAIELLKSILE